MKHVFILIAVLSLVSCDKAAVHPLAFMNPTLASFAVGDDSDFVHRSGNIDESINGQKTFADGILIGNSAYIGPDEIQLQIAGNGELRITPTLLSINSTENGQLQLQNGQLVAGKNGYTNVLKLMPATPTSSNIWELPEVSGQLMVVNSFFSNLDFPATSSGTSSDRTMNVPGAKIGDYVLLSFTGTAPQNSDFSARVSNAGVVTVRYNNYSAISQNPPAAIFRVSVQKF